MRGFIVVNAFSLSKSTQYKVERLQEEFAPYDIELDIYKGTDLPVVYRDGCIRIPKIQLYDFCIYLDKDRYLSFAIESMMPMFNSARSILICDDKMDTYLALKNYDVKTPLTIPSPLNYSGAVSYESKREFLDQIESRIPYPLIVKQCYGSLGKQVHLIRNRYELNAIYELLYPFPHLYQEYMAKEYGTDYRIMTVGGRFVAGMKRQNDSDFRSNIALGGRGLKVTIPQSFIDMAEKVSQIIGLDYSGVDILVGNDGEPVLAEVNSNAFFTEIEKISEINITQIFVRHILDRLKKY